jgi:hypothetical protein
MKIQLKRSNILQNNKAKKPTAEQMEYGELAVNYNANDPVIFLKDSNDQIIEININNIGSIDSGSTPPTTNNNIGDLFFNNNSNQLLFWDGTTWVALNTNLGYTQDPTKGTVTSTSGNDTDIPLADGTNAGLLSPGQYTELLNLVGVVLDSPSNGLTLNSNNELSADIATGTTLGTVKIGTGLGVTADGTISVTGSGSGSSSAQNLSYTQGATNNVIGIDGGGTDATILLANASVSGLMSPGHYLDLVNLSTNPPITSVSLSYTQNGNNDGTLTTNNNVSVNIPVATGSTAGLMTGTEKTKLSTLGGSTGGLTAVNLDYTPASDRGTVTCSAGDNAVIPIATANVAGLMTPSNFTKLSSAVTSVNLTYTEDTSNGAKIICDSGSNTTIPYATASDGGVIRSSDYVQFSNSVKLNDGGTLQYLQSEGLAFSSDGSSANVTIFLDRAQGQVSASKFYGETVTVTESVLADGVFIRSGGSSVGNNQYNISIGTANGDNLKDITTGSDNIAIGRASSKLNKVGIGNIAIGQQSMMFAGQSSSTPYEDVDHCIAIGYNTLANFNPKNTTTNSLSLNKVNIAIGHEAALYTSEGYANTVIGYQALKTNEDGFHNVVIGCGALKSSVDCNGNTAIGTLALENFTHATSDDINHVSIGKNSMRDAKDCIQNVAVGNAALRYSEGDYNVAVGQSALLTCNTGHSNTAIGYFAAQLLTTGYNNTVIGYQAGVNLRTEINSTCVGNGAEVSGSNQVQLGSSSTTPYVYNAVQTRSDARDKTDIRDTLLGLDFIKSLRPVDFRWDYREDYYDNEEYTEDGETLIRKTAVPQDGSRGRIRYHHGLIAQEVKQAADDHNIDFAGYQDHSIKGGDDVLSIGYSELIAPLIKAVQQLSEENADLKARLEVLENS